MSNLSRRVRRMEERTVETVEPLIIYVHRASPGEEESCRLNDQTTGYDKLMKRNKGETGEDFMRRVKNRVDKLIAKGDLVGSRLTDLKGKIWQYSCFRVN